MHIEAEWTDKDVLSSSFKETNTILNQPCIGDVPYTPGDFPYWGWGRTGWVCPKCGRVNSPDTNTCPCSEPGRVTISTTTTGSKDFQDYLNTLPTSISMDKYKEIVDNVEKKYYELSEEERKELLKQVTCEVQTNVR